MKLNLNVEATSLHGMDARLRLASISMLRVSRSPDILKRKETRRSKTLNLVLMLRYSIEETIGKNIAFWNTDTSASNPTRPRDIHATARIQLMSTLRRIMAKMANDHSASMYILR